MSKLQRCGNCKHWRCFDNDARWWKDEDRTVRERAYGTCGWVPFADAQDEKSAFVEDDSGYYAALRCRADFGCVAWEPANVAGGDPK